MEREPVESSALASVGYDRDVLEVEFVNGSVYQYVGVPVWVYEALMMAQSYGRFNRGAHGRSHVLGCLQ